MCVLERSGVAAGASGVQPGGVRQQWSTAVSCGLARESSQFYQRISEHLESSTRPVLEMCGYLFVADTADALRTLEQNVAIQNEIAIPSRILSPAQAEDIVPGLRLQGMEGAAYCGEDGYFDKPQAVVEAFAASVTQLGGTIEMGTATTLAPNGTSWKARLADGRDMHAGQVVVAAGFETRPLLEPLVELPIVPEPRYLFLSEPIRERLLEPLVVAPERAFAAKQLANGRVLASDLGAEGDPEEAAPEWRKTIYAGIESLVPILEYVSFPIRVDGVYDVTPDNQPILDSVPGYEGLWVAAGLSGHGFMLAPAIGRLMAEALNGDRDPVLGHFTLERFARGDAVRETQVV